MLVWKGFGFLAPLIVFLAAFIGIGAGDSLGNKDLGFPVGILIGAVIVYLIGIKLAAKPGRVVIDKETNQEVELKSSHSFMWIPMPIWGPIFGVIGIFGLVKELGLLGA